MGRSNNALDFFVTGNVYEDASHSYGDGLEARPYSLRVCEVDIKKPPFVTIEGPALRES